MHKNVRTARRYEAKSVNGFSRVRCFGSSFNEELTAINEKIKLKFPVGAKVASKGSGAKAVVVGHKLRNKIIHLILKFDDPEEEKCNIPWIDGSPFGWDSMLFEVL